MAGPTFAVMDIGEELIDQFGISVRIVTVDESVDFLRTRRQADQIKVRSADQLASLSDGIWNDSFFLQPGEDESVNVIPAPRFGIESWRNDLFERLESPKLSIFDGDARAIPLLDGFG